MPCSPVEMEMIRTASLDCFRFFAMRTFALSPDTIRRQLRRVFWRFQIMVTLSFLAFGGYLALNQPVNWAIAAPILAVIALVYFLIIFIHYRQQQRTLNSFRLDAAQSSLTLRQWGQPPLMIARGHIYAIQDRKDGLWIYTADPRIRMHIPRGLDGDGDQVIRALLASWKHVERVYNIRGNPDRITTWLMLIGSVLILLFGNTLYVIVPVAVFLFAFGTYAERRILITHDLGINVSRLYSMAFGFLIFMIAMKTCVLAMFAGIF